MTNIFISHAEEDGNTALDLARGLETAGYSAWSYERDSYPGLDYLDQVGRAIDECQAVVVVISPDSLGSQQVEQEVKWARDQGKHFLPVLKGMSWAEFQNRRSRWRFALGIPAAVVLPPQGADAILPTLTRGLKQLGVEPGKRKESELSDAERQGQESAEEASRELEKTETRDKAQADRLAREKAEAVQVAREGAQAERTAPLPDQPIPPKPSRKDVWSSPAVLVVAAAVVLTLAVAGNWMRGRVGPTRSPETNASSRASAENTPAAETPAPISTQALTEKRSNFASEASPASTVAGPSRGPLLFHDDFSKWDAAGWGSAPEQRNYVENGKFIIQPEVDRSRNITNNWEAPSNADASVNVKFSIMPDPVSTGGRLIFGAVDSSHFYALGINSWGEYAVQKLTEQDWSNLIDWTGSSAIKTGIGESNLLRVVTRGDKISCYINGVQVVSNLAVPVLGEHFGLGGMSPKAAIARIEFSDLKVVQPIL